MVCLCVQPYICVLSYTRSLLNPYLHIVKGSRDLILEFWDLLHISGTVEARNLKFGIQADPGDANKKNEKLGRWRS